MSGCAAIGLALGRTTRAQSCGRTQDQEDDRPTRQWGTTSQDERGRRFAPPCAASEAARRRHTSPPTEARADVGARFARGGPFGGPRAAARIHHRLPTARRSGRRACQEDERRGRTACSQRGADAPARRTAIVAHVSTLGAPPRTRLQPRVQPRVEREGEPSSWQARAGAGPWAGPRPPRAKRAPASARASVGGEVWRRRAASEAAQGGAKRATAFILRRGAPLSGWPVVLLVLGSAPRSGQ